jgi:nuclear RNA export factor
MARPRANGAPRGAPTGPKATTRGGVAKRRPGATKTDLDGDLDMDAIGKRAAKTAAMAAKGGPKARTTRSAPGRNPRGVSSAAQSVLKHLKGNDASTIASKVSAASSGRTLRTRGRGGNLHFLRVHGLKQSKATSNQDGGLSDLLAFLERKASSFTSGKETRQIMIKKVCRLLTQDTNRHCPEEVRMLPHSRLRHGYLR